ncbi:MAG: hypothetical protein EP298_03610 [Gammaproteobacteria bacterium]|nr:MAG: hypothetical protein EP298_03610 [Gammaproteobacteria bacterium]UTW43719.1 hypothetical protein KFE69_06415 [bacterium SCSIO 12844]
MITEAIRSKTVESNNPEYSNLYEVLNNLDENQQTFLLEILDKELSNVLINSVFIIKLFDILDDKQQWSLVEKLKYFNLSLDDYIKIFQRLNADQQSYLFDQIKPQLIKLISPVSDLMDNLKS